MKTTQNWRSKDTFDFKREKSMPVLRLKEAIQGAHVPKLIKGNYRIKNAPSKGISKKIDDGQGPRKIRVPALPTPHTLYQDVDDHDRAKDEDSRDKIEVERIVKWENDKITFPGKSM